VAKFPDALSRYAEVGVTRVVAMLASTGEADPRKAIDRIASRAGL
jgi:hypothetical protein